MDQRWEIIFGILENCDSITIKPRGSKVTVLVYDIFDMILYVGEYISSLVSPSLSTLYYMSLIGR